MGKFEVDDSGRNLRAVAEEASALLGSGRQVTPFSARDAGFTLRDAYVVVEQVKDQRRAGGETAIGRKIGFTNTQVWTGYGLGAPIWNYVFDKTVFDLTAIGSTFALPHWPEPRIEPEIVLHLARAPTAEMSDGELLACVDWIAPGFELVYSIFPDWAFTAADATAGYGLHGALLLGRRLILPTDRRALGDRLNHFTVEMTGSAGASVAGHARNVLGGPVKALRFLVAELERGELTRGLNAGELVTTGTLTEALAIVPGQTWTMTFAGIEFGQTELHLQ